MNWTEGSLARHSRGRSAKETTLRQKQHFAKVRSGLSSTNVKNSPVTISFLGHVSSHHLSPRSSLERVELPSTQNHNSLSTPSRKRRRTSLSLGQGNISSPKEGNLCFNMTGPGSSSQQEEKTLDESRRKLLQKSDWVGIAMQKPLDLQFSTPRNTPGHPWGEYNPRHATLRRSARHLIGSRYDELKRSQWGDTRPRQSPVHPRDFRIRVGSREVQLGVSSNAQVSSAMSPRKKGARKRVVSKTHRVPQRNSSSSSTQGDGPVIYQPVPRRLDISQLLRVRSADSQIAESTMATVGLVSSPMAPSQIRDNELWKSRIGLHEDTNSNTATFSDIARVATRDVTPGVSELAQGVASADQSNGGDTTTYAISSTKDSDYSSMSDIPNIETTKETDVSIVRAPKGLIGVSDGSDGLSISRTNLELSIFPTITTPREQHRHNSVSDVLTEEVCTIADASRALSTEGVEDPDSEVHKNLDKQSKSPSLPTTGGSNELVRAHTPIARPTDSRHLPDKDKQVAMTSQEDRTRAGTPEDENEVWKRFVFGLSDDAEEKVLQEARKEAARALKPSETSSSANGDSHPEWGSNVETGGSSPTDPSEHIDDLQACASHLATLGPSSLASDLSDPSHPNGNLSLNATSMSPEVDDVMLLHPPQAQETNYVDSLSSLTSEPNSTAVEPPKSLDHEETGFRFAPPRTFVGKLSGTADSSSQHCLAPEPLPKRGRKVKSTRKGGANDGRTDIRALPNYIGDPIEEFDEGKATRVARSSLFGQLETQ